MNHRKRLVLQAIVKDYIATAEPVGSRTIARRYGLGVSPATIRNEMADLEEQGFIVQPHTSAGRIPTDSGYRFYVDELMESEDLAPEDIEIIHSHYAQKAREMDHLIRQTAMVLSEMTDCFSVVLGPEWGSSIFRSLQLLPLRDRKAILLLINENGLVHHKLVEVPPNLSPGEMLRISEVLTNRLGGFTLEQIGRGMLEELEWELRKYRLLLEEVLEILRTNPHAGGEGPIYLGGAANVLKQPEFREIEKVQTLLGLLEKQVLVRDLLGDLSDVGAISVVIGNENKIQEMQDCSVVTATFAVRGGSLGRIGVLGPRRMDYPRIVALVDYVTRYLNECLKDW